MKRIILFLFAALTIQLNAQNIVGDWSGVLSFQGMELQIIFHVTAVNGIYQSTMDSPDQGATGIAMDQTNFEDGKLTIEASALGMKYTAELKENGETLDGTFVQQGISIPLELTKGKEEGQSMVRPQDPRDFPYRQEEVRFENPSGGHYLAGTLTLPEEENFEKVVILVSGSGPQDRNEQVLNHRPFLVLSDYFTRQGIGVLRYDDRGVAQSEGEFATATSEDFADDASAALAYLKSRADLKDKAIGIVGHSEGGMIAPMVASEDENVDFIVLLAAPGIEIKELLLMQQDKIAEANGVPNEIRSKMVKMASDVFDYIDENIHLERGKLTRGMTQYLEGQIESFTTEEMEMIGDKETFINQQTRIMSSDWYLYFMRFKPDKYLQEVNCPVLAVNGELDLQVTANENLEGIHKSLKKANNRNVSIHEFKGLNHLFQQTETGAPSEYGTLEETFNEEAMAYISNWILALEI